jgi:MarR family 2-MHQ and catechol resistance regulon transcriptional repressor
MFTIKSGVRIINRTTDNRDRYLAIRAVIGFGEAYEVMEDVFSTHLARFGLSGPKFRALIQLHMAGDTGLTQSDLGKKLQVSRANITGLVERLEKDGLVVRHSHPSDRRAFRICLTARGGELINACLPVHNNLIHRAMSSLSTEEKEMLTALLEKLKKGFEGL